MQRNLLFIIVLTMSACSSPPTPIDPSLILADFPLAVGTTWEYAAEISYQDPADSTRLAKWTGSITDKIVAKKNTSDGQIVFTMEETLEPTPPSGVWRVSNVHDYVLARDGVYFHGNAKIYQYPLSDNLSWKVFQDKDSDLFSNVRYIGKVTTPYRTLKNCYLFTFFSKIDIKEDIFCSGVGFAVSSYRSFEAVQIDILELVSFEAGK